LTILSTDEEVTLGNMEDVEESESEDDAMVEPDDAEDDIEQGTQCTSTCMLWRYYARASI